MSSYSLKANNIVLNGQSLTVTGSNLYFQSLRVITENLTGNFITTGQTGVYKDTFYSSYGGQVSGAVSGRNIISNKYGDGAGIYTFSKTINPNISSDIFSVFSNNGALSFQTSIGVSTTGYSVMKNYLVIGQINTIPVVNLLLNSGPWVGQDFTVSFSNTGSTGVLLNINNNGSIQGDFFITMNLGGSNQKLLILEY